MAIPMVGAASPLLAIPAITSSYGAAGWGAIAIGQSMGAAGGILVELAWNLNGPQRIAKAGQIERLRLFRLALVTKLVVFALIAPIVVLGTLLIVQTHHVAASMAAVATAAVGLSPSWYFLGIDKPLMILRLETLPRVAGVAIGSGALVAGASLWVSPAFMLFFALISIALGFAKVSWGAGSTGIKRPDIVDSFKTQSMGLAARATSGAYIALPVTIVGIVAPSVVPQFAAIERMFRLTLVVLQSVPNAMQSWVGSSTEIERARRCIRALGVNIGFGLVAMVAFGALTPYVAMVLFTGQVEVSHQLSWLAAVNVFVVVCSRATGGLILVQYNRIDGVAWSAAIGASVGVASIAMLAYFFGAAGAVAGEFVAEACVLALQASLVALIIRKDISRRNRAAFEDQNAGEGVPR